MLPVWELRTYEWGGPAAERDPDGARMVTVRVDSSDAAPFHGTIASGTVRPRIRCRPARVSKEFANASRRRRAQGDQGQREPGVGGARRGGRAGPPRPPGAGGVERRRGFPVR